MTESEAFELCVHVREAALASHRFLKHGHVEKIYETSLANRLLKRGLKVQRQIPIAVHDEDGSLLGEFFGDLLVEKGLLVELKAVRQLVDEHTAQVLGYLRATRFEHALLVNFGSPVIQFKKFILTDDFDSRDLG